MQLLSSVAPIRNHRSRCHTRSLTPRMIILRQLETRLCSSNLLYCIYLPFSTFVPHALSSSVHMSTIRSTVTLSPKVSTAIQETDFPSVRACDHRQFKSTVIRQKRCRLFYMVTSMCMVVASIYTTEFLGRWARFDNSHPFTRSSGIEFDRLTWSLDTR